MEFLYWAIVVMLGLCFGSFGTVLTTRIEHGTSIVRPASRCLSCERPLRRRDRVPLLSYVVLRGRCRDCGATISPLYPAIEAVTALLFCFVWWKFGPTATGLAFAGLAVITPPLTIIDVRKRRLPNLLTAAGAVWALLCAVVVSVQLRTTDVLITSILSGAACAAGLLMLAFVSKGGMGMGDIKLAGVIGLVMGTMAWTAAVAAIVWAFVLGAVIALILMLLGRARRGTAVPFGPMLISGAWIVLVTDLNPLTSFLVLR